MGFILEQQQPGFLDPVPFHVHLHRAGVDFFALVQFVQFAMLLQVLHRNRGEVHQAHRLLFPAEFSAHVHIALPGLLQHRIFKADAVDLSQEGGMTAVIAPVGVQHPDFRDGGFPAFFPEPGLAEGDVIHVHGQAVIRHELLQAGTVQLREAFQGCHFRGHRVFRFQGFRQIHGSFPGFHRVDHVLLDFRDLFSGQAAVEQVNLRAADERTLALGKELNALGSGVRPLVKLTGQVFHREHGNRAFRVKLIHCIVQLGLREHLPDRQGEHII